MKTSKHKSRRYNKGICTHHSDIKQFHILLNLFPIYFPELLPELFETDLKKSNISSVNISLYIKDKNPSKMKLNILPYEILIILISLNISYSLHFPGRLHYYSGIKHVHQFLY